MIYIGYAPAERLALVAAYRAQHGIRQTIVITADQFPLTVPDSEAVAYRDVIRYVVFYRLLQIIDGQTLVVLNECLRTQNRHDLAYNCIRHYLNRTPHRLIFQHLPLIDTAEDFMVLFDWDTDSRWKRQGFDPALVRREAQVQVRDQAPAFTAVPVPTAAATRQRYERERERLFAGLGGRDPHTLPRNLALLGGRDKKAYILAGDPAALYVARNQRLGLSRIATYETAAAGPAYTAVELPHRFLTMADFLTRTGLTAVPVLVADLKVDHWYFERYREWSERIHAACASLS